MKIGILFLLVILSITSCTNKIYKYPDTLKLETVDTIWGRTVQDPFRWLEDLGSNDTRAWINQQNRNKNKFFGNNYIPMRRYLRFYSQIDYKPIIREGKYYFMYKSEKRDQTPSLYYHESEDKEPKLLFNPNTIAKNAIVSIDYVKISADNKTLALILSENSGDWKTIRFLDIERRRLLPDTVKFVKYSSVYWSGEGIFYTKYDVQSISESFTGNIKGRALYYHRIGTPQEDDILIFRPGNDYDYFSFQVPPQSKFLVIYHACTDNNIPVEKVSLLNLPFKDDLLFHDMIISTDKSIYYNVLGEIGGNILVHSNLDAENGAIYKFDPEMTNQGEVFIPQYIERLEYAKIMGNKLVKAYRDSQQSFAVVSDTAGQKLSEWEIPEGYTFSRFTGSIEDSIAIYYFNSFFSPASIYKVNLNTFEREPLTKTSIWFDNRNIATKKVYYYSKDGTQIPMYITHRKDLELNGNNPTILYGYGGFGVSMDPFFSVPNIIFLNSGGVLATPALRGGGDYPGWHEMGMRLNKQNTFDDFISAAQYLIDENYTNSGRLAAMGGSHGGLVVGASMVQRPDLFKVVVSKAGVLDMMRYHLYNIGYIYQEELGNIKDSLDFENLISYSPVNNVKPGVDYPATLLVASDNDDRVLPFHSFKLIAELQAKGTSSNPYVLYFLENSGHSGSAVFDERLKTDAYIYSFIFKYLGMEREIVFDN